MLACGGGYDLQFLVILEKVNLKDIILWNGVHFGIAASSETLNIL